MLGLDASKPQRATGLKKSTKPKPAVKAKGLTRELMSLTDGWLFAFKIE
jgi:hypothetical protein